MEYNASNGDVKVMLDIQENGQKTNGNLEHGVYAPVVCNGDEKDFDQITNGKETKSLGKDFNKVLFLIYLYFLQGIPLGLGASMPFLLSARGFSYADQGTFSFAVWPFSIKILWAPFVDSLYFKRIGRRKTWLVPIQFLMALFLFTCADRVQLLVDTGETQADILFLTFVFGTFITLAATQDIAVDGWAITMLSKENLSWQATCNFTGQAIGFFFGNIIFIVLESSKFSNQLFRPLFGLEEQTYGIITLKMFMYTFGVIFIVTTFMILFFINEESMKSIDENSQEKQEETNLNLFKTYKMMWKMLNLARVRELAFILLTSRIGWATDSALFFKMIDYGVAKEVIALLTIPLIPLTVLWPLFVSKWTKAPDSLMLYCKMLPLKLIMVLICCTYMYFLRDLRNEAGEYGYLFVVLSLLVFALNTMIDLTRATSLSSFMARVSDESIGGTYMTFLNTLNNLGGKYPGTVALFLINWLTKKYCSPDISNELMMNANSTTSTFPTILEMNTCSTKYESTDCVASGGICITSFDAFYYMTLILVCAGGIWLLLFKRMFQPLSSSNKSEWKIVKK